MKKYLTFILAMVFAFGGLAFVPATEVAAEGELPELIYWTIGGEPQDLEMVQDAINDYAAEEIGAKINYFYSDWGEYGAKMQTIINSNEYYDMAFGSAIDGYADFAQQGIFKDISPELENVPELVEYVPEALWDAMTLPNGEIYGVPTYKDSSATQYWVWQKSVVDALDIDYQNMIELADVEPALEAIKNWDGYEGEYPLYMDKAGINSLFFDYEPVVSLVDFKFGETEPVILWQQDDVVDRFETLRKYYDAGYINPDANTLESSSVPKGAMVLSSGQGWPGAEVNWTEGRGHEVVIQKRLGPVYTTQAIQGSFNVVSAASDYAQEALNYLQKVNLDHTMRDMVAYGVEGTHFEYTDDNKNVIKKTDKADDYSVPAYTQGTFFTMSSVDPQPADQWSAVEALNEEAESSPMIGFVFDPHEVENEIAACKAVQEKYEATLLTGAHDGDKSVQDIIDTAMDEFETAGLNEIFAEVQRQASEFVAAREAEAGAEAETAAE